MTSKTLKDGVFKKISITSCAIQYSLSSVLKHYWNLNFFETCLFLKFRITGYLISDPNPIR